MVDFVPWENHWSCICSGCASPSGCGTNGASFPPGGMNSNRAISSDVQISPKNSPQRDRPSRRCPSYIQLPVLREMFAMGLSSSVVLGNLEASQTPSPLLRIRAGIEVPATIPKSDSFALQSNQTSVPKLKYDLKQGMPMQNSQNRTKCNETCLQGWQSCRSDSRCAGGTLPILPYSTTTLKKCVLKPTQVDDSRVFLCFCLFCVLIFSWPGFPPEPLASWHQKCYLLILLNPRWPRCHEMPWYTGQTPR